MAVIALMVIHSGFSEYLRRWTEPAADVAFRQFVVPSEIEGGVFRKKDHPRVRQFVVNEPGQRAPVLLLLIYSGVDEPRDDNAGCSADAALGIAMIPNMASVARLVAGALHVVDAPIAVYSRTSEGGANDDRSEDA